MKVKTKSAAKKSFDVMEATPASSVPGRDSDQKHHGILLVLLAYIIGFTTAFIAFGLTLGDKHEDLDSNNGFFAGFQEKAKSGLLMRGGSLFVKKDGGERVLSAEYKMGTSTDGYHYKVVSALNSPDNRFVYYCVVTESDSEQCASFIYSIENDVVYRVKNDEGQLLTDASLTSDAEWSDDGRLTVGGYQSASSETPWKVIAR